jgi:hypothetical protein
MQIRPVRADGSMVGGLGGELQAGEATRPAVLGADSREATDPP